MLTTSTTHKITWEKLPDDFVLDDEPVDSINQPILAAALTQSLDIARKLPSNALTTTNYGICATLNNRLVVKAPDWSYIPSIKSREEVKRSYTPQLEGDIPVIVMEFLSNTEGNEYSSKPTYPPGKIFEPDTGVLEVYKLDDSGRYKLQTADANNRYWIAQMQLSLGIWEGMRENRTGYWLRWWNENGELLLWGSELAFRERQRAEAQRQRAERLAQQLRAAGIEPEE